MLGKKIYNTSSKKSFHFCFISPSGYPLFVKSGVGTGGAERQFMLFGEALLAQGARVSYITEPPAGNLKEMNADKRFGIFTVPIFRHGKSYLRFLMNIFNFFFVLLRVDADFYLLKLPSFLLLPSGIYCKLFKKKLVFWAQLTNDTNLDDCDKFSIDYFVRKFGINLTDVVIAQSKEQYLAFLNNFNIGAKIVPNIHKHLSGNKVSQLDDQYQLEHARKEFDVIWVGNSSKKKRWEIVYELAIKMPDIQFIVAMNNLDKKRFIKAENSFTLLPNVKFLGMVPPYEMDLWYNKSRILLNTSIFEGFPNTFLQALAYGVPIVSLNIDPDSIIVANNLGRVASSDPHIQASLDFNYLADQLILPIRELLNDESLREKISISAKNYIKLNHEENVAIEKLLNALGF